MLLGLQACAGAQVGVTSGGEGGSSGGPSGGGGSSGGPSINLDVAPTKPTTNRPDLSGDVYPFKVDDAGQAICLSILSYGQVGTCGGQNCPSDAFMNFMNTYSANINNGTTSVMTSITTRTTLTDEFSSHYNVIVLQALEDSAYTGLWSFTAAEVTAMQNWVTQKGGALITMTGYGANTTEITPTNQLLAFSGIQYNSDDIFGSCLDNLCYCRSNSVPVPVSDWQTGCPDCAQLTLGLKEVGMFHGRSISCTGDGCEVFAKDPTAGNIGVAKVVGNGRVLAWADEWVTYTSQWGLVDSQYDNTTTYPQCIPASPKNSYSVPQFWYDIFSWSAPNMQWCFTITVPPDAPPSQTIIY